jgi:hypothetical protein
MDATPFLEIDLLDLKNNHVEELKKFHKTYFDVDNILSSASELKYTSALKAVIGNEFGSPSPEFVKLFAKQVYDGIITNRLLEQFTALVRKSITGLINDIISDRLKTALKTETVQSEQVDDEKTKNVEEKTKEGVIVTTEEELEGFFIIKAILRPQIASERITYRDAQSYFAIFIDDNNRKAICRLYFNSLTNKQLCLFDENKKEIRHKINSLDDIYNYSAELTDTVNRYIV